MPCELCGQATQSQAGDPPGPSPLCSLPPPPAASVSPRGCGGTTTTGSPAWTFPLPQPVPAPSRSGSGSGMTSRIRVTHADSTKRRNHQQRHVCWCAHECCFICFDFSENKNISYKFFLCSYCQSAKIKAPLICSSRISSAGTHGRHHEPRPRRGERNAWR